MLCLVIFAVVGRGLFETIDPKHFGNFGTATFTLIQLLTLDDWFEIFTGVTDKQGWLKKNKMIVLANQKHIFCS